MGSMKQLAGNVLFQEKLVIKVNKPSDPICYVCDYQYRHLTMEFQHFHEYYEMYLLLDDDAAHVIEGEFFHLQRYDLVLLKPMLLHKTVYPEGENPKARLIISFNIPPLLPGFERQIRRLMSIFDEKIPIFRFGVDVQQRMFNLFNDIYTLGTQGFPGSDLIIHARFQELLWLIGTYRKENRFSKQGHTDSMTEKIYEITRYLHVHYPEEIPLTELACLFSISPFYLSRQFRHVTGTTFVIYLQLVRVRNAQHQLLYTSKRISEISEACGFSSFSQFNRVFHKYCSMSPTAFRKAEKNQAKILLRSIDPEHNAKATLPRILQNPEEQ